ncbi:MAG: 50S ribosomal protein L31 [Elusimicrobiales bacterium]|nr:50S ribosomal protein L31 [Elusimicrobiales bacterium]
MKENIHPKYEVSEVVCACGNSFITRSTKGSIKVEICSNCHPFYTGKHKIIDTEGRVEKFKKKYASSEAKSDSKQKSKTKVKMPKVTPAHRKATPTGVKTTIKKVEKEDKTKKKAK